MCRGYIDSNGKFFYLLDEGSGRTTCQYKEISQILKMFKATSSKLSIKAMNNGVITSQEIDETTYALNNFFTLLCNIITALVIGVIFNMVLEMVLFILSYKSLRKYCGGGHAKTAITCYISSCITYGVVLVTIKFYPLTNYQTIILVICACIILFILSPVEAIKKPLDDIEKKVFRFRSRISIVVYMCIFLILHHVSNTYYYSLVLAVNIVTVTVFAIEGKIQLKYAKSKKTF